MILCELRPMCDVCFKDVGEFTNETKADLAKIVKRWGWKVTYIKESKDYHMVCKACQEEKEDEQ